MAVIVRLLGGEAGEQLPSLAGTFLVVEKPVGWRMVRCSWLVLWHRREAAQALPGKR